MDNLHEDTQNEQLQRSSSLQGGESSYASKSQVCLKHHYVSGKVVQRLSGGSTLKVGDPGFLIHLAR